MEDPLEVVAYIAEDPVITEEGIYAEIRWVSERARKRTEEILIKYLHADGGEK